jgi:phospholipid/cholesterol/gamma-HCH transport system ATP-binding protein
VADRALYLDDQTCTMTALGPPQDLLAHGPPTVRQFLSRRDGAVRPAAVQGRGDPA